MKNEVNSGGKMTFTAGANIASGQLVVVGALLGVAITAVANGAQGTLDIEGAFDLPKVSGDNIAAGAKLTFDTATGNLTTGSATTGDLVGCAVALAAAGAGTATVRAKLCPGSATVSA